MNTTPPMNGDYMLTAWNDLGMHCMDGNDFSVFSVLPPYNNLHAQIKDKNGDLITSGITITYESTIGTDGQINTTSSDKTNFWDHVTDLFGTTLSPDVGLTGNPTASTTPALMVFNATHEWWEAEGIPLTPYNDNGSKNYYPLVKVVAKDSAGTVLAEVKTVLPVSDEMDCKRCHSGTIGECTACHTSVPNTTTGGPHGMHPVGTSWVKDHKKAAENNSAQCTACHGQDYRGSALSKMFTTRTLDGKTFTKGQQVSCYACHGKKW